MNSFATKMVMIAVSTLAFAALSCTDDTKKSGTTTGSGGAPVDETPPDSCVKAGEKGNDIGIGMHCTPGGGECTQTMPKPTACLADLGQTQWFCTKINCKDTAECGVDTTCFKDGAGSACVPNRCLGGTGGAGGSGGTGGAGGMGGSGGTGGAGGSAGTGGSP